MSSEPRTSRGRASRERIVERAAELLARHGVQATSLDDVRVASGASKSQLYHYFTDRDDLVEAAVAHRCRQVIDGLTWMFADVATMEELDRVLASFVAVYEQTPSGCPIGTLAGEVADRNEGARAKVVGAFADWERLLADAFERMRTKGELRPDASPAALATALLASIEGGLLLSNTRRDAASLRIAVAAALGYARTFCS